MNFLESIFNLSLDGGDGSFERCLLEILVFAAALVTARTGWFKVIGRGIAPRRTQP